VLGLATSAGPFAPAPEFPRKQLKPNAPFRGHMPLRPLGSIHRVNVNDLRHEQFTAPEEQHASTSLPALESKPATVTRKVSAQMDLKQLQELTMMNVQKRKDLYIGKFDSGTAPSTNARHSHSQPCPDKTDEATQQRCMFSSHLSLSHALGKRKVKMMTQRKSASQVTRSEGCHCVSCILLGYLSIK
jgi:hypothetical protein